VFVRYPWNDANGDGFVQRNEVNLTVPFLSKSTAYDPANPTSTVSPTTVDSNVKNDRTREFIVGFDRQLASNMAIGGSYIWRQYDQFLWNDRIGFTSADYRAVPYQATTCPAGARCEAITYYEPTRQIPSPNIYTNIPDRYRDFNGFELTFQKRYSNRWQMSASYAYNNAVEHFDSANAYEDPTCVVATGPGSFQYAPESGGSGIGGIFQNAKSLYLKVSGRYTLPLDINLAGFYNGRQGYPFPQSILTPNRANGGGTAQVLLDPLGDTRLDNLHMMDFRVDKVFRFGNRSLTPTFEIFNLTNANTVLAIKRQQAATNANTVSGIVAPRVIRFGLQVKF
jgi:hypothetical protein